MIALVQTHVVSDENFWHGTLIRGSKEFPEAQVWKCSHDHPDDIEAEFCALDYLNTLSPAYDGWEWDEEPA